MKKMLTVGALLLSAALLFGQASEVSKVTSGLIEDNAIDQLDFGTEDGKGLTFIQFENGASTINFGYGKWLQDSFWLSFYDEWYNSGSSSKSANVSKTYGTKDGINIDYTDTTKTTSVGTGTLGLNNKFAVGLGFGNFGTQIVWDANWTEYNTAGSIDDGDNIFANSNMTSISSESTDTPAGSTTTEKYDKIKHFTRNNKFIFNFAGAGIKDIGDKDFYAQLNTFSFNWQNTTQSNTYDRNVNLNGKDINLSSGNATINTNNLIPGLNFELGLNISNSEKVSTKLIIEDDFSIGFKANKQIKSYTTVGETATTKTTEVTEYKIKTGKYVNFENTITPKFVFNFNFDEKLKFIARVSAGLYTSDQNIKADTYEKTVTTTTEDRASGNTTVSKVTTTSYRSNDAGSNKDKNTFTISIKPIYDLGIVYQIKPEKVNLNAGVNITRSPYKWTVTKTTNANINTKQVTENTDALGNTTGSTTSITINNGGQESKQVSYTAPNGVTTALYLGATWFFNENVKLDAYWKNSFQNLFGNSNNFGIDLCVKF